MIKIYVDNLKSCHVFYAIQASLACSSFNFDELKSNLEDVSKEGHSEKHPVQHPAGNETTSIERGRFSNKLCYDQAY